MRRVDQFHSGTAVGDAITQQLLFLRARLRALGYESDIYAQHIPSELSSEIIHVDRYSGALDDLLLVHHSIGHTAFEALLRAPTPIITVFHSITPARFFRDATLRYYVRLGLQQIRTLAGRSLCGVADSNHNRHEMLDAGFREVSVLPVRTEFAAAHAARRSGQRSADWLFVGRVAPNKHQVEIVRAFAAYSHAFNDRARLRLVGDTSMVEYADDVRDEARRLSVDARVTLTGKVDEAGLWNEYSDAGLFVCLSEHEGFGVPLLEAMAAGIPVVARSAAAVQETMGGSGVLVDAVDPWVVAAVARLLDSDDELRRRVVEDQDARVARIEHFDVDAALRTLIERARGHSPRATVQVQGPFETSYSLAVLNRELALGLAVHPEFDVTVYATEGPGDYVPKQSDLAQHPRVSELFEAGRSVPYPDVVIRQMYPPRVDDSPGAMTFQYFGWEESRLPEQYVRQFNEHLDGIGAMSHFVADLLRSSGVVVPIEVVGVGVRAPASGDATQVEGLPPLRRFRFLHISAAFPRKGVDVLLEAYFASFTGDDDVSLVLKTYPNPHNVVGDQLAELRGEHANPPDVCWIDRDLTAPELGSLYGLADAYVHPARGEGFGLPVAEAMLAEVPVIAPASTGLADFVNESTAATIPFRERPAQTHLTVPGSTWMEPDRAALAEAMRQAFDGTAQSIRDERVVNAKRLVATEFSWPAVANRWAAFVAERRRLRPGIKVAMITTWNSRCGIAEYAKSLVTSLGSDVDVEPYCDQGVTVVDPLVEESTFRTWRQSLEEPLDQLYEALKQSNADVVHIQYNLGFFSARELDRLIQIESKRRPVIVTLHRTADLQIPGRLLSLRDAANGLRSAARVIVHQHRDMEFLAGLGVTENVDLIPIGCEPPCELDMQQMRIAHGVDASATVIGTFGFLLPHKGTLDLIRALPLLRANGDDIRLIALSALHPDPSSAAYREQCVAEIRRQGLEPFVSLKSEFLPTDTVNELLSACDAIVLPYHDTRESSSAALRSVLPIGRPTLVSDVPIFDDARSVLHMVPGTVTPPSLATGVLELFRTLGPSTSEESITANFCRTHSWQASAAMTRRAYEKVLSSVSVNPALRDDGHTPIRTATAPTSPL